MALIEEMEKQGNFLFKHRGSLPVLLLIVGMAVFARHEWLVSNGDKAMFALEPYRMFFALFISLVGFAIRAYTVGHTPKNTSGRNTAKQLADELNTSGIYSVVRHPLYVGNFFMWLGMALLTMNFWFITTFVFLYWVYYERIMFAEEQFLRSKFGKVYTDWAERTPAFIPGFKNWKRNTLPFNRKKVVAKEKTGLVLVFLAFFLFNVLSDSIRNQGFIIERDGWLIAFAASLVYYFVVKVLRKHSSTIREKV